MGTSKKQKKRDGLRYREFVLSPYGVIKIKSLGYIQQSPLVVNAQREQPVHCILIDECQFLTREQVNQLSDIVDELDIPVLCYGLRTDFQGELFSGSQYLLAWADKLIELKTVCHCVRKANRVLRLDAQGNPLREGEQVVIGGQ